VCVCVCVYIYIYVCVRVITQIHFFVCSQWRNSNKKLKNSRCRTSTSCMCIYIYIHICKCVYIYIYICVCSYMYICVCVCLSVHIYIYINMYMCIYNIYISSLLFKTVNDLTSSPPPLLSPWPSSSKKWRSSRCRTSTSCGSRIWTSPRSSRSRPRSSTRS